MRGPAMASSTMELQKAPGSSLFELEQAYQAFLDTDEAGVPVELEPEFREQEAIALKTAVEKRERFGQFVLACERRVAALKAEAKRITDQAAMYERAAERARAYGASVIESLGKDAKGKYRKLEGNTVVLSLRAGSPRVEFTDEAAVPSEYKTLTITVPATEWEKHMRRCLAVCPEDGQLLEILSDVSKVDVHVSKTKVKEAIERGKEVPGADVRYGDPSLVIK